VTGFDPVACRFTGTGWEHGQSQQRRTQTGRCDTPADFRLLLVRHGSPAGQGIVRAPIVHELPGPERPALEAPAARELHLHFHGTSPQQVAEILRSHELPDEYRRGT
jgi:hypothetical protein